MKTQAKSILLSLVLLVISIAAIAQPSGERTVQRGGQNGEMRKGGERGQMMKMLDLTDDQKEQMKAIKSASQKEMLPLKNTLGEKEAKLKTLQTSEKVDMQTIENQIEEVGEIKIQMAKIKARSHQDIRAILTEDQRIMLDSKFGEKRNRGKRTSRGSGK